MNAVTVQVTMTVLVENNDEAVAVAQRWLPRQRELPLSCSDGATLTAIEVLDEHKSKARINWGNVVAYLSVLFILGILLWIFVAYTDVPR